jgi:hypothetical protein
MSKLTRILALTTLAILLQACPAPTAASQPAAATSQRATSDRPDEVAGLQVHPIYVLPPGATDHQLDTSGAIHDSLQRINAWFREQTDGRSLRIDTFQGKADVTFHRLSAPVPDASDSSTVLDHVVTALQEAGLDHPQKVMLILYGENRRTDWTGVGGNLTALVQVVPDGRWPAPQATFDGLDKIVAHELLHAIGAVPAGAPHRADGYHAGDDPQDVMTARPDRKAPWRLDVGRDDYYGHGRSDLQDLARSFYWEPLPGDAAVWAGQPLTLSAGANPTAMPVPATVSDPALEGPAMAVVQRWRQQAGQGELAQDEGLRRLLSRYLDGRMGQAEATSTDLRFHAQYAGDFHVWRRRGRLAPGGDPAVLLAQMAEQALADGGKAVMASALTGAGAVCRREGDDLWLAIGVGTAPVDIQDIRLSEGPHATYTLTGQIRRRPGSGHTLIRVGSEDELGYSLRLQPDWTPFAVSVPKDRHLSLRLRVRDGANWAGPALLGIDGRQPLATALTAAMPPVIDKPMADVRQF